MATVALGSDFLDAYARIPRAQQRKVRDFTEKFKANPKSPGINYEKIHDVRDDKVRTVRIDQKYRAVVLHPGQGDVYILAWVDNHDEAMAWARNRVFEINPVTGALQIINVSQAEQVVPPQSEKRKTSGLLSKFDDALLLSFGLPAILLPAVRAVRTPDELLAVNKHLPAECAEALTWLAEGIPPEEIRAAVAQPKKEKVDTGDLAAALAHPDTRRRFVTILSDKDLTAILDAPLEKWRVFLHPSQEKLVAKKFNGPAKVTGGAGTGKTVVAMHRAKHLASKVFPEKTERILFTTFTANLAQNVEQMLSTLCPECMDRLEVLHLHAWAVRFLRSLGLTVEIASHDTIEACWEEAVVEATDPSWDTGFFRLEWEQVVQANGIQTQDEYLRVLRTGRGRTVSRPQRARIWKVFEHYRHALAKRNQQEWLEVIQTARRHLEEKKAKLPYRAVVVDESQDFHNEEWKLIRALVPAGANDLFLVGDAHQRIYGRKVVLSRCGITIQGRSSSLRINYRTTEQIRAWAVAMVEGMAVDDLDGEADEEKGYMSLLSGPKPECHRFASAEEEQEFLGNTLKELIKHRPAEEICLVARTTKIIKDDYQALLKSLGIEHLVLDKSKEGTGGGVRLATMHRVKGLEFPVMILAGMNSKVMPLRIAAVESDPTARKEHEDRERSLLFVAATRARDQLIVTSWGTPSPFLAR
jgi:AAA domain/UvrD-like helicase C-terminal domain